MDKKTNTRNVIENTPNRRLIKEGNFSYISDISSKKQLYFWEKSALKPEDEKEDKISFYEVEDDPSIREVIRNLESKIIGKRLLFSEVSPENPSVKKWINIIRESYPKRKDDIVEDLINTFRRSLYPRSKGKYRFIVGVLLLNDMLLLVHCKKDPSLAELEDKIYSVKLILHSKNVLRVAIIKDENGKTTFSAFEYNRKWSKGHAEFWEIEPEDVSWEVLGSILLNIELETFSHPVQLQVESEQLDEMMRNNNISPTGKIKIGREAGKITKVGVFRKSMDFLEFYDFYITEKEKLEEHRKKFKEMVHLHSIFAYDLDLYDKYKYEEDEKRIFEITPEDNKPIYDKSHPRFTICFSTKCYPGIKPTQKLIFKLYQSIFENHPLDVWHAGEKTSQEAITIGCLSIYNRIKVNQELDEFSNNLLNIIQDATSKKKRLILQDHFCNFWKENIKNKHCSVLFDSIIDSVIIPELEFEFKNGGILDKEDHLEFKSADEVSAKPSRFVKEILIPTIRKYLKNGKLTRLCILYGIEDNGDIKPLYNLKNDRITDIEKIANKELSNNKIQINVHPIPFKEGIVLLVFLIPVMVMVGGEQ